ncbi:MAG: hypothetical protein M3220_11975 [Chloroflexota bacterium]|nr:hypothetical protein [Chloroflexota bacterium]
MNWGTFGEMLQSFLAIAAIGVALFALWRQQEEVRELESVRVERQDKVQPLESELVAEYERELSVLRDYREQEMKRFEQEMKRFEAALAEWENEEKRLESKLATTQERELAALRDYREQEMKRFEQKMKRFEAALAERQEAVKALASELSTRHARELATLRDYREQEMRRFEAALAEWKEVSRLQFENALQRALLEHQVQLTPLQETRVGVLEKLYQLLVEVEQSMDSMLRTLDADGDRARAEQLGTTVLQVDKLVQFFDMNRIYFGERLCRRYDELNRLLRTSYLNYKAYADASSARKLPGFIQEHSPVWNQVPEEIRLLKQEIEKEFRGMLGIRGTAEEDKRSFSQLTKPDSDLAVED